MKRLQRVQLAVVGFVLGEYSSPLDVLTLGLLPIKERRDYHLSKLVYKVFISVTGQLTLNLTSTNLQEP